MSLLLDQLHLATFAEGNGAAMGLNHVDQYHCQKWNTVVNTLYCDLHRNYIAGVRHDEEVHQRPMKNLSQALDLDVVMLGLDSTSRLAWQRHLPKSRDYFVNVLKGTEMEVGRCVW